MRHGAFPLRRQPPQRTPGRGEATALARRLTAAVASATRLTMLEVLSAAADEITRDLAPGSVEVRLHARDPYFVVTPADTAAQHKDGDGDAADPAETRPAVGGLDGPVSRINFRPPEQLKQRIEAAAAEDGMSVNSWLVHTVLAALAGEHGPGRTQRNTARRGRFTGWVG